MQPDDDDSERAARKARADALHAKAEALRYDTQETCALSAKAIERAQQTNARVQQTLRQMRWLGKQHPAPPAEDGG